MVADDELTTVETPVDTSTDVVVAQAETTKPPEKSLSEAMKLIGADGSI